MELDMKMLNKIEWAIVVALVLVIAWMFERLLP